MSDNPYTNHDSDPWNAIRLPRTQTTWTRWVWFVLVIGVVGAVLYGLLIPVAVTPLSHLQLTKCRNNLKWIGLALHNYHDEYGMFPPAYSVDENGVRLHSWRTLILPFADQQLLYDKIDLSKPWNDPANSTVSETAPALYRCPSAEIPLNFTTYCGLVGDDSVFHPTESRRVRDITDGTTNTLMVLDVPPDSAVHWMEPRDTAIRYLVTFGSHSESAHESGTPGLLADGSAHTFVSELTEPSRRALLTIAGGEELREW